MKQYCVALSIYIYQSSVVYSVHFIQILTNDLKDEDWPWHTGQQWPRGV